MELASQYQTVAFPEEVTLDLISEAEVDKRGE